MSYTALYRKWRPAAFGDVKGQDHIVQTLKNQITTCLLYTSRETEDSATGIQISACSLKAGSFSAVLDLIIFSGTRN